MFQHLAALQPAATSQIKPSTCIRKLIGMIDCVAIKGDVESVLVIKREHVPWLEYRVRLLSLKSDGHKVRGECIVRLELVGGHVHVVLQLVQHNDRHDKHVVGGLDARAHGLVGRGTAQAHRDVVVKTVETGILLTFRKGKTFPTPHLNIKVLQKKA